MKQICDNRDRRVRKLRAEGRKIGGYLCCYTPVEILTAANLVPYRIFGNMKEATTVADAHMEPTFCPFVRSCFDMGMKGRYSFLDCYISPDSCDNIRNLYDIWLHNLTPSYSYYLNIPRIADPASVKFFREELAYFKRAVEEFVGGEIPDNKLREAIELHNQHRALLRGLYELRKPDPPLLYGSEVTQILVACMSLPIEEANDLLRRVIAEIKGRHGGPQAKLPRLLLSGNEIDDPAFVQLVEQCGANVVADDLCIGTRYFWHDVEANGDPLDGLTIRYLDKIMCPRTYRGRGGGVNTRGADLEDRFGHVMRFAEDFNANGVILYVIKYCDAQEWDAPDFKDYLEHRGIPVLHIEHDYSIGSFGPLRTRIQAFLEMIS